MTSPSRTPQRVEPRTRGWLVRDELDRSRLLDVNGRVRTARRIQGASCGGTAALASIWCGWWILALAGITLIICGLVASSLLPPPAEVP